MSGVWRPLWLYGMIMLPTCSSVTLELDFLNYLMLQHPSDSGTRFRGSRDSHFNYENIMSQYLTTDKQNDVLDCDFQFDACGWEWFSKRYSPTESLPDIPGPSTSVRSVIENRF